MRSSSNTLLTTNTGERGRFPAYLLALILIAAGAAHGHPVPEVSDAAGNGAGNAAGNAAVSITSDGAWRTIVANGLPDHKTGQFPGPENPNRIAPQQHRFRVPLHPARAAQITPLRMQPFGIALNGVPFDPLAAEWWNHDRSSGWQYEAMSKAVRLGLDGNHAHVQPSGAYHYHGIPTGLAEKLAPTSGPLLLGYAADGFPIYGPDGFKNPLDPGSGNRRLRSSYRIRQGERLDKVGGPGGTYDGSFIQDYEFVEGLGDLDECNGREGVTSEYPDGTYLYVLTDDFPYVPRSFRGEPDSSFSRGPHGNNSRGNSQSASPRKPRGGAPPHGRGEMGRQHHPGPPNGPRPLGPPPGGGMHRPGGHPPPPSSHEGGYGPPRPRAGGQQGPPPGARVQHGEHD